MPRMTSGRRSDPSILRHLALGRYHQLEGHGQPDFPARTALGPVRAVADRGEGALDRVRGADVLPALGRKVVKVEQDIAILRQLPHGLRVRPPDIVQMSLGLRLHGFRHGIEHIGGLVDPAAPLLGGAERLPRRRPEARGSVADGRFRGVGQTPTLEVEQQFASAPGAFAVTVGEVAHLLAAPFICADRHRNASFIPDHSGLEVDTVGPDMGEPPSPRSRRCRRS